MVAQQSVSCLFRRTLHKLRSGACVPGCCHYRQTPHCQAPTSTTGMDACLHRACIGIRALQRQMESVARVLTILLRMSLSDSGT